MYIGVRPILDWLAPASKNEIKRAPRGQMYVSRSWYIVRDLKWNMLIWKCSNLQVLLSLCCFINVTREVYSNNGVIEVHLVTVTEENVEADGDKYKQEKC